MSSLRGMKLAIDMRVGGVVLRRVRRLEVVRCESGLIQLVANVLHRVHILTQYLSGVDATHG